jgi:hypothetical protein
MIPFERIQGTTALIVGIISAVVVWSVIWLALNVEKKHQANNPDEH